MAFYNVIEGTDGSDTLLGGGDNDYIFGGAGRDVIDGATGDDRLRGYDGSDTMAGGAGADQLLGGTDGDVFIYRSLADSNDFARDIILDFQQGLDVIDLSAVDAISFFGQLDFFYSGGLTIIDHNASDFSIALQGLYELDSGDFTFTFGGAGPGDDFGDDDDDGGGVVGGPNSENIIYGTDDADMLTGGAGVTIFAGAGNDTLIAAEADSIIFSDAVSFYGGLGDDALQGNEADDFLQGNTGDDIISGLGGEDTVYGGRDDDLLFGNEGGDVIFGDRGNDLIRGGKNEDALYGGEGDDTIYGDLDSDTMTGGIGRDLFIIQQDGGDDVITDFDSGDHIQFLGLGFTAAQEVLDAAYEDDEGNIVIPHDDGQLTLTGTYLFELGAGDFLVG